jgi:DNA-binding HxlR family transcriptional regulator
VGQDALTDTEPTPLEATLTQVGDRWSLLLIDALLDGPRRFNDLQSAVNGIATNVLTDRLRQLTAYGVVVARPYSTRPLRYTYELTRAGHELAGALRLLSDWGSTHGTADAPAHTTCGTKLEARWYCPTCDHTVEDPDPTVRYV